MNRRERRQTVATRLFANALAQRTVPGMVLGLAGADTLVGGVLLRDHHRAERAVAWSEALTYLTAVGATRGLVVEDCWFRERGPADEQLPIAEDPLATDALLVVDADRGHSSAFAVPYRRDDQGQIRFGDGLAVNGELTGALATALRRALRSSVPGGAARFYPSSLESVGHTVLGPQGLGRLARGPCP